MVNIFTKRHEIESMNLFLVEPLGLVSGETLPNGEHDFFSLVKKV